MICPTHMGLFEYPATYIKGEKTGTDYWVCRNKLGQTVFPAVYCWREKCTDEMEYVLLGTLWERGNAVD